MTSNAPNFTQPDKYIYNPYSGTCYMRYDTPKLSWEDARTACDNEGYDVRFATFKTPEAVQFIIDDYQNASDGGGLVELYFLTILPSSFWNILNFF